MANGYAKYAGIGGGGGSGSGVSSLNSLTGAVTLAAGTNVTITPSGNTLTIASTGGGGGVTSVGLTDSTGTFTITNSPVTTSGNLTLSAYASQTAKTFLAAPNGTSGAPSFRTIVATDVPTLNQNTTGTAANITATSNSTLTTLSSLSLPTTQLSGQVTLAQLPSIATLTVLGNVSGSTTTPVALTATQLTTIPNLFSATLKGLVPLSGGGTTNFLRADGTWAAPSGGGGGTVTSVDMSVPAFLSVSGNPITTSGTLAVSLSGTALPVANGGTGDTTLTANSLLVGNGTSGVTFIAPGTSGNVLASNGTTWASTSPGIVPGPGAVMSAYMNTSTSITGFTPILFDTKSWDSNTAYNTSTGLWTAPFTGYYNLATSLSITSTNTGVFVAINGTASYVFTQTIGSAEVSGAIQLKLNAGDTVALWPDGTKTVNGVSGGIITSVFSISQIVSAASGGGITEAQVWARVAYGM